MEGKQSYYDRKPARMPDHETEIHKKKENNCVEWNGSTQIYGLAYSNSKDRRKERE